MAKRKQSRDDAANRTVKAFLNSTRLDRSAAYASRGRVYGALTDGELSEAWARAFKVFADDPFHAANRAIENDLEAEFDLRGREVPFAMVKDDVDRLTAKMTPAVAELKRDSDKWSEVRDGLADDLGKFLDKLERGN